jgi:NitT/TauT family transport system substrate-binding protein
MRIKKLLATAAWGVCALMLPLAGQAQEKKLEPVTYLLPAPQTLPTFAPWMIAKQQGYFEAEGLDVNYVTAKGGVDVAKQVGAGNAPIGGAIGDTPIIVRANGVPVKSVGLIGGGGLTLIASHAENPIKEPADLKGKVLTTMAYTDTTYYSMLGTMRKAGLKREDADIQSAGPAGVWQLFASGKAQGMAAVGDWVVFAEDAGAKVYIMDPAKGFNSMTQAIIASDEMIQKNPEFVRRVVRATLKGMTLIQNDIDAAVAAYVKIVPMYQGKEGQVKRILTLFNKYMYSGQKVPGMMDPERLAAVQKFYVDEGIVAKASPLDSLYTNQFVEAK